MNVLSLAVTKFYLNSLVFVSLLNNHGASLSRLDTESILVGFLLQQCSLKHLGNDLQISVVPERFQVGR